MVRRGVQNEAVPRDLKNIFRERAKALRREPEIFRSALVTSLIAESVGFGIRAEAEFFRAAYDDPAGRDYWAAHLSEPTLIGAFAYLLSVHLQDKPEQLESTRIAIALALRDAGAAGESFFVGEIAPLLAFDLKRDFGPLVSVKVRPREATEWLLSKPKRAHLVPHSLRLFLDFDVEAVADPMKRRSFTEKSAGRFAEEFIKSEKAVGRHPTLVRLEAAAREAGYVGGREFLRGAFRRSPNVTVREGRPPKLAE